MAKNMGPLTITAAGKQLASGAASAVTTLPNASSGEVPKYIRVAATAAACIRLGTAGVTATNADTQVQPGDSLVLCVPLGITHFAVIQQAAAGVVQVSPCENV